MEQRPSAFALILLAVVVGAYLGLILLSAAAPGTMAAAVFGAVPLSFVLAIALIVVVLAVTAIYVAAANRMEARR